MFISVIVPFFNEASYIKASAEALVSQDFPKEQYEVIFVDNGSVDGSASALLGYEKIKVLQEERRSPYAARNKALALARGDIIAFTDADCIVAKDWLRTIHATIADKGADIVLGKRSFVAGSPALKLAEDYGNAKIEYIIRNNDVVHIFGYTNNMALRAGIFKEIGLFSEWGRAGDTEFVHRALSARPGTKVAYSEEMAIVHLEITGLWDWLKKNRIYGSTNMRVWERTIYRTLTYSDKISIFRYCASRNNYGAGRRVLLFLLLVAGDLAYKLGTFDYIRKNAWFLWQNKPAKDVRGISK